jgi:hypothetical protein
MASILSATRADPLFEAGVAPTLPKRQGADVGDALAKLAHHAAIDMPDPELWARTSDGSADARSSHLLGAATRGHELGPEFGPVELGPADLGAQFPREPRSFGKRRTLARVVIALCLGAAAIWAWRAYGAPARDMMATLASPFGWISARPAADQASAPKMSDPPAVVTAAAPALQGSAQPASTAQPAPAAATAAPSDSRQIATMARDLAAMRQTIDRLTAGQEQLTRQIAKLEAQKPQTEKPQAEKPQADKPIAEKPAKRVQHHVSEPGGAPQWSRGRAAPR